MIIYKTVLNIYIYVYFQFDVARWLVTRRPRLSERSQFIELVGKALTTAGLNPEEDKLILHEVKLFLFLNIFEIFALLIKSFDK